MYVRLLVKLLDSDLGKMFKRKLIEMNYKTIPGYPKYAINRQGDVINKRTFRTLKQTMDTNGYMCVSLYKNSISEMHRVHKMLADLFINREYKNSIVQHVNKNRTDNRLENLRFAFHHRTKLGRESCPIAQTNHRNIFEVSNKSGIKRYLVQIEIDGTHVAKLFERSEDGLNSALEFSGKMDSLLRSV